MGHIKRKRTDNITKNAVKKKRIIAADDNVGVIKNNQITFFDITYAQGKSDAKLGKEITEICIYLMENSSDPSFILRNKDCIFLRAEAYRRILVSVAEIESMYERNGEVYLRVRWFYRPQEFLDLSILPDTGVNELFESEHYQDMELSNFAGKCLVGKREDYGSLDLYDSNLCEKRWTLFENTRLPLVYYARFSYQPFQNKINLLDKELRAEYSRRRSMDQSHDIDYAEVDDESYEDNKSQSESQFDYDQLYERRKRKRNNNSNYSEKAPNILNLSRGLEREFEHPCRDEEKRKVEDFVTNALESRGSRCLYISGVPGTGKTATVIEVLLKLQAKLKTSDNAFSIVEINGMTLPDPYDAYKLLYECVTGKRGISGGQASQLLEKKYSTKVSKIKDNRRKDVPVVVVMDEMDILLSRKNKVLYDFLEWPTRINSNLVLIGIANMMDLPRRLPTRLESRIGFNSIKYTPYTASQLEVILGVWIPRLYDVAKTIFEPTAIKLCTAKVANVSGDVRRALEICRRAQEIAHEKVLEQRIGKEGSDEKVKEVEESIINVSVMDIQNAVTELSGSNQLGKVKSLAEFEILFLLSIMNIMLTSGTCDEELSFSAIHRESVRLFYIVDEDGDEPPSLDEMNIVKTNLNSMYLIIVKGEVDPVVTLNISMDDLKFALEGTKFTKCFQK